MVNIFSSLRTSTTITGTQPSIFEVWYPDNLATSLTSASKFCLKILAHFKGSNYSKIHNNFDELYLLFNAVLNLFFLKQYGASFFEHFYGIKRIVSTKGTIPSSNLDIGRSLGQLILLPYLKEKIASWKEQLAYQTPANQNKWKRLLLRFWPYIEKILAVLGALFQILYLFNYSSIHSPDLLIAGVHYEKYSDIDLKLLESNRILFSGNGIGARFLNLVFSILSKFGKVLSFGMVAVQVAQYVASNTSNETMMSIINPGVGGKRNGPVDFPVKKLTERDTFQLSEKQCPLCLKSRKNDTVLSVSGYIFCFTCIYGYVTKHGQCPVTSTPATNNNLVRLYSN
uniref:Peroxisome assembly protein 12 n=1 Tax=Rhabditophanes sp. KR3021 TaxID=114890 RepID=A0AC35TX71_9BILA